MKNERRMGLLSGLGVMAILSALGTGATWVAAQDHATESLVGIGEHETPRANAVAVPDTVLLLPGRGDVDASAIRPYGVVWVQYFETGRTRTLRRTVTDRVERRPMADGGSELVRTQTFLGLDGDPTSERVNRVDGVTLVPRRERWRFGNRVTHVDYQDTRVRGAMLGSTAAETALLFDEELARTAFDFNTTPLLLAAVGLESGTAIRLPHVRISPPAFAVPELTWAVLEIDGREEVGAGPLGRVTAWRVVDREHEMVFWLIPDPPYVVRIAFPIDDSTLSVMELGAILTPWEEAR